MQQQQQQQKQRQQKTTESFVRYFILRKNRKKLLNANVAFQEQLELLKTEHIELLYVRVRAVTAKIRSKLLEEPFHADEFCLTNAHHVQATLRALTTDLFCGRHRTSWIYVVELLEVSAAMAEHAFTSTTTTTATTELVEHIVLWVVTFLNTELFDWIALKGGWCDFVEWSRAFEEHGNLNKNDVVFFALPQQFLRALVLAAAVLYLIVGLLWP